jgi:cytochrome c553
MKRVIVSAVLAVSMLSLPATSQAQSPRTAPIAIHSVSVKLPAGDTHFPEGPGAALAGKCLICHSASMVQTQPSLTQTEWKAEINKMRTVYGAPIDDSDVETLSAYLAKVSDERNK